jgi:serine phosphatase RsbU (regulator of sigma subunit)
VLFTDGLYEQENAEGEQFGHRRLIEAVSKRMGQSCDTLLGSLVSETQRFSGHEDFADDVCMVGMDVVNGALAEGKAA